MNSEYQTPHPDPHQWIFYYFYSRSGGMLVYKYNEYWWYAISKRFSCQWTYIDSYTLPNLFVLMKMIPELKFVSLIYTPEGQIKKPCV